MIELKIGDLLRIKTIKDGEIQLVVVEKVDVHNKNTHNYYYASNCLWFNDDFMDDFQRYEIIAVWRYNEETGNFLKIYDREELCQTVKPADVPYDKYISLEHENAELRNIIVELNKKIYRE